MDTCIPMHTNILINFKVIKLDNNTMSEVLAIALLLIGQNLTNYKNKIIKSQSSVSCRNFQQQFCQFSKKFNCQKSL